MLRPSPAERGDHRGAIQLAQARHLYYNDMHSAGGREES